MRHRLRSWIAAAALLAGALVAGLALPSVARAEGETGGHDRHGTIVLDDLSVERRQLAMRVWSVVICNCPRENWSKTLLNCPDGCADAQKQEILQRIEAGWDADAIFDEQKAKYGPKVIGKPDDVLTYLLPVLVLVACGVVVALVFARWRRETEERRRARDHNVEPQSDELAAIERELEEMR